MRKYNVVILGATGLVGQTLLTILEARNFPIEKLYVLASSRSVGEKIRYNEKTYTVQDAAQFDFTKAQIGFFSAGSAVSAEYVPKATKAGCVVIDNTSHFRYDDDVPLVIPEVNPEALQYYRNKNIVANPNCSTMQLLVALKPLYDAVGIARMNVATYQSVSGTGRAAMDELASHTQALLQGRPVTPKVYPTSIAFNVIPHIDIFEPNGYTKEEMKVVRETRKILNDNTIQVNVTAVRVPVFYGHSEAVHIETREKITATQARALLQNAPGVIVKDDLSNFEYPMPVSDAAGTDPVFVGRIREDISHPLGLNLWIVSDNIRKGAALNSIQIAEKLIMQPSFLCD